MHALNKKAAKYIKQQLSELKGGKAKSKITFGKLYHRTSKRE